MKTGISAVVNTRNEEANLEDCLKSLQFADEIVVVDTESTDKTVEIASKYTDKIFNHKHVGYVEPVRNFAINKAAGPWILLVDADERVPKTLAEKLVQIVGKEEADFVRIPRQNYIFGEWIQHSRWWPDYNIRFFKKGVVTWQEGIHSVPITEGRGINLEEDPKFSLTHLHYKSIDQYLERSLRYSGQQAKEVIDSGYQFDAIDLITKPIGEFMSRFFAGEGYKDGLHGLVLSLLQAFSVLIVYLKVWQEQGHKPENNASFKQVWQKQFARMASELNYWFITTKIQLTPSKIKKSLLRIKRKFNL